MNNEFWEYFRDGLIATFIIFIISFIVELTMMGYIATCSL